MAISKIKLGNGTPQAIRDAASLHYIGHAISGITGSGTPVVYTSPAALTINSTSVTVKVNDYVTLGDDNINYVCVSNNGSGDTTCTWHKLTEKAAEIPVQTVKVNGTALTPDGNHAVDIPAATASGVVGATFGVVETGDNITNTSGVISVADASTSGKGVVQLADEVDGTSATADTDVPTVAAVASAIEALPEPMVFKGSVGDEEDSPTIEWDDLAASAETVGFTYKVVTAHATAPICKVGDTIICAETSTGNYSWIVIPSGDEPSGTVTSVGAEAASGSNLTVSGSPITSSGTITVGVAANYSIPSDANQTTWTNTSTEVAAYTKNNTVVTGLGTTDIASDSTIAIITVDGSDTEQLNVLYLAPTTNSTAVFKPTT